MTFDREPRIPGKAEWQVASECNGSHAREAGNSLLNLLEKLSLTLWLRIFGTAERDRCRQQIMGVVGSAEIRVKGDNGIEYACPDLIYHYIRKHRYLPPQEFLDAMTSIVD